MCSGVVLAFLLQSQAVTMTPPAPNPQIPLFKHFADAWRCASAARLAYPVGFLLRGPTLWQRPYRPPLGSRAAHDHAALLAAAKLPAAVAAQFDDFPGITLAAAGVEGAGQRAAVPVASAAALMPPDAAAAVRLRLGPSSTGGRTDAEQPPVADLAPALTATRVGPLRVPAQLWAACLPTGALAACRPGAAGSGRGGGSDGSGPTAASRAAAEAAGWLPAGPPLRLCRTPEAAAEAVDLTLLALAGPLAGIPLNRGGDGPGPGLGVYGWDLDLLLPSSENLGTHRHPGLCQGVPI
ncbi:hypothetical protein GPECTOR_4g747 [Gonium pectorale]|uniref:Uncharacterized protein n=1 Tax=Gonium pectorale TaxID=33097 RepID=A0A150GXX5_GONPE|nr:hypothetical protein GPECTOR_4g747 [Gonium pectorale]|eukprot:KXZ54681.1 hypothetical protein GPECTOR_4g747 [Gonium pectorale]